MVNLLLTSARAAFKALLSSVVRTVSEVAAEEIRVPVPVDNIITAAIAAAVMEIIRLDFMSISPFNYKTIVQTVFFQSRDNFVAMHKLSLLEMLNITVFLYKINDKLN